MYFPFLRGKQFELIALRELTQILAANRDKISPIIEPVKESNSTLSITLDDLIKNNINFNIMLNPIVGDLRYNNAGIIQLINEKFSDYSNFQIAVYIDSQNSIIHNQAAIGRINVNYEGITLVHIAPIDNLNLMNQFDEIKPVLFNLINLSRTNRRYHRHFEQSTRVSLEDHFKTMNRNADYSNNLDEHFSEEHLFYKEDGFVGFSDYLTIGEQFAESGFLPYAVAIHLTYKDAEDKIRIRHFVSDSNDDTSDVGGKFAEALQKLVDWVNGNDVLQTFALREFLDLHRSGHFPGLGVIKKLSLKHHIELVLSLI
jgi:hypothetical protein